MTSAELNAPKDYALYYHGMNLCVIVLKNEPAEVRKRPAVMWELYQIMRPSEIQLERWFAKNSNYNIAAVTGNISMIIALDVDGPTAAARVAEKRMEMSTNLRVAFDNTMVNKTGSGGTHIIFRLEEPTDIGGQKLLWTDNNPHSEIKLKGNGGYIVMPPSIHENGQRYQWNGNPPRLITADELDELTTLLSPPGATSSSLVSNEIECVRFWTSTNLSQQETRTLTNNEMQQLLYWIRPYYTPGNRNNIVFYLSGMMRKNGFTQVSVRRFVTELCNSSGYPDENLDKSLTVVDNTYDEKPLEELNGKSGLYDLLVTSHESTASAEERQARVEAISRICQIINNNDDNGNGNNTSQQPLSQPTQKTEDSDAEALMLINKKKAKDETTKIIAYITNKIMDSIPLRTYMDTGEILYYEDGVYNPLGDKIAKMEIERIGDYAISSHMKNEILEHIKDSTAVPRSRFNSDPDLINIKNGLLNIFTQELKPHSPSNLSTIQYPYVYDQSAECPTTEKFLADVIQDPYKLREFLKFWAYCLLKDCRYEKAAMFVGSGANGKGKLINLMEAHEGGYEKCSHVSLHDMGQDRFATAGIWGKTLNTYADLEGDKIKGSGNIKTIISGDSIEGQFKNKPRFTFRNFAKIVYSANNPPETEDKTYAFYRRWLVIPFDRTFINTDNENDPNRKDPNLLEKLITPQEMSGALNLRLKYLQVLLKENGFAEESFEVVKREYESRAEHISKYLSENCTVDFNKFEYWTRTGVLYAHYLKWCKENNITTPLHETTFGSKLMERGIVKKDRKPKGQERGYYYRHVVIDSMLQGGNMSLESLTSATVGEASADILTTMAENSLKSEKRECQYCKQQWTSVRDLQVHIALKHPGEDLSVDTDSDES